jgi:hypothetical protein
MDSDWGAMQALSSAAYAASLPHRSQAEIDHLTQIHEPGNFRAFRIDPSRAVAAGRLNPHQSFGKACIVTATHQGELVGYGRAVNNTSGANAPERWAKMHFTLGHRVVWLAEVVVDPDYWLQRIGTRMAGILLAQFNDKQPVSAYTWRENEAGMAGARSLGFVVTDPNIPVHPFGDSAKPAMMVRWEASNAFVQAAISRQLEERRTAEG